MRIMGATSSKFWSVAFIVGVGVLLVVVYLFFSSNDERIEASDAGVVRDGVAVVYISHKGFKPQDLIVGHGTQVKWINNDEKPHRVAFRLGSSIENLTHLDQELKNGESVSFMFEKAGVFSYFDKNGNFGGQVKVE